jgi:hypothetical protein
VKEPNICVIPCQRAWVLPNFMPFAQEPVLSCKIISETDLMHEPPDHHAPGEAPEVQDDVGATHVRTSLTTAQSSTDAEVCPSLVQEHG